MAAGVGNIAGMLDPIMSLASNALFIIVVCIAGIILLGIVAGGYYFWLRNKKRFEEFDVEIYGQDDLKNPVVIKDNGGIFVNRKTGNKRLFLKNAKISLPADAIPYILSGDKTGKKYVKIKRIGLSNYVFMHIRFDEEGMPFFTVGEEDVNWALDVYKESKKRFEIISTLEKWIAPAMFVVSILIVMIIVLYFFNKFEFLNKTAESLSSAMGYAWQIAQSNAQNATIVLQGA